MENITEPLIGDKIWLGTVTQPGIITKLEAAVAEVKNGTCINYIKLNTGHTFVLPYSKYRPTRDGYGKTYLINDKNEKLEIVAINEAVLDEQLKIWLRRMYQTKTTYLNSAENEVETLKKDIELLKKAMNEYGCTY